jgi:hypothetical protein
MEAGYSSSQMKASMVDFSSCCCLGSRLSPKGGWWQWQLQGHLRLEFLEGAGEGLMPLLSVAELL